MASRKSAKKGRWSTLEQTKLAKMSAASPNAHMSDSEKAQITSVTDRMMDMPAELIDQILETAVESESLNWRPSEGMSLQSAVDTLFTWSCIVEPAKQRILDAKAVQILLKTTIIELPAHFTPQDPTSQGSGTLLDVPSVLQGNEQHIRRLVLDLHIDHRDAVFQRQLNRTIAGMDGLKALFPSLKVCIISFFLKGDDRHPGFTGQILRRRNRTSFTTFETLGESLRKCIDVFNTRGPGRRKLIRFCEELPRGEYLVGSCVGPPVDVGTIAAELTDKRSVENDAGLVNEGSTVGERALARAWHLQREGGRNGLLGRA